VDNSYTKQKRAKFAEIKTYETIHSKAMGSYSKT